MSPSPSTGPPSSDSPCPWPDDSIVVCSFGDASANHSTALGAINTAVNSAYQGVPTPILFVCEDNGIGISTKTAPGWIASTFGDRAGLEYFAADGSDLPAVCAAAATAARWVREHRRPAFLHVKTVRLMGHAGSDHEAGLPHTGRDPRRPSSGIPSSARRSSWSAPACLTPADVLDMYEDKRAEVLELAEEVVELPQLSSPAIVMEPITDALAEAATITSAGAARTAAEEYGEPLTLARAINRALSDVLTAYPGAMVFGEDVARKGGVYGVTRGLLKKAGPLRVFDTVLDEQAILGLALGAGLAGMLPIPEIQYLAYLHNAADQIRGEGATLQFFSNRQYRNPMVVRIAGYGYQKGFGGHFHNDNAIAALRDIPGIIIASPARPDDAAAMMHTCAAVTHATGALCVYLEPIALYHTRDLHEDGDGRWLAPYPDAARRVPVGSARTYGDGTDLTIVTYANGLHMSLRVARRLEERHGISARVRRYALARPACRWRTSCGRPTPPAAFSWSTRPADPAACRRESSRPSSTTGSPARSAAWRARTASFRSATPHSRSC